MKYNNNDRFTDWLAGFEPTKFISHLILDRSTEMDDEFAIMQHLSDESLQNQVTKHQTALMEAL